MNDFERMALMQQKANLRAEILELTRDERRVKEILNEIERIDKKLGA